MTIDKRLGGLVWLMLIAGAAPALADSDMPGSRDYEGLPRVEGTWIVGHQVSRYDAGIFVTGVDGKTPQTVHPEGRRTRIVYLGEKDQTPLQLLRNYQTAFADFGAYTERYRCADDACFAGLSRDIVWSDGNRIQVSFRNASSLYTLGRNQQSPRYVYGTITTREQRLHVSAFATFVTQGGLTGIRNVPILHLEILEEADFEPTLVQVEADEIVRQIDDVGSVALYGIRFELNSAAITVSSEAAIAEIAKALDMNPDLDVFVVGHTDNAGTVGHNQTLSMQRAEAVVDRLVAAHGVAPRRLSAVGVGPVAPLASNATDAGRALNRRVQIVGR